MSKALGIRSNGPVPLRKLRQYREEFKARKEALRAEKREANRKGAHANLARRKLAHKRSDPLAPVRRLTPSQFAAIRPELQEEARRLGLEPLDIDQVW